MMRCALVAVVLATGEDPLWGEGPLATIPTYMIAPQTLFEKRTPAMEELGLAPNHIKPRNFFKERPPCRPNTASGFKWPELGCFESHRDAWLKIAAGNANSLVLEADWTIANQSVSVLKQDFRETVVKMDVADIDLVWAGRCYGGIYCTTAYFVSPYGAKLLAEGNMCKYGTPLDHYMPFECGRTPFHHAKADYTAPDHKGRVIKHNRRLSCGVAKRYPVDKYMGLYGDGPIFQDRSELRGMHACRTCKNMTNSLGYNLSLELDPGEQHDTYAFHRMSALFGDPAEIKDQAAEQVHLRTEVAA